MATLVAIPILGGLLVLQTAIVSQITLLHGSADLILLTVVAWALQKRVKTAWQWGIIGGLFVGFASALPLWIPLLIYPLSVGLALFLRRRVWQVPILAMFVTTFFATLLAHLAIMGTLRLGGAEMPLLETLNLITLPGLLLNMLLAVPVYVLIGDLARWLYPEKLEA